ncbi:hypothetical protein TSAR_010221 [Trichomalopsis sarcophagae]|uniref:Uncharacterized protein n=1 Tax=Trichomalopsis sarcophagae TaxID=543379 RepID=A0A232FMZ3_9HYME|nr:hypothetical protein TSAR_010221 [Trichomalopsis sarcophagae]
MLPNQQHIQKEDNVSHTIKASNVVMTKTLNKRKAMSPSQVLVTKKKNGSRKPSKRHTKPDALVIKAAEGNLYADILRKIRAYPNLTVLSNSVNKIRKTVAEDLLLELRRTEDVKTQELPEAVKAALVEEATIKRLQHIVVFKIKDLDMLTSK